MTSAESLRLKYQIPEVKHERPLTTVLHLSDEEIKKRFPRKIKKRYSCRKKAVIK